MQAKMAGGGAGHFTNARRVTVITATDLEVRAGARTLLFADGPALRIQPGDRIGLVGRNGAGKTTTLRILAGESEPYAGTVTRNGEIGYLPQDPKEGDLDVLARDRVLSAPRVGGRAPRPGEEQGVWGGGPATAR